MVGIPQDGVELREWRVVRHERLRPDVVRISVVPADGSVCPTYFPGSHLALHLPLAGGLVRCYALISTPGEASLDFVVQGLPGGRGSQYLLRQVVPGTILMAPPPSSNLLPAGWDDRPRTWFLIGGAIGTASLLGLARGLLSAQQPHRIAFLAAHRSIRDILLQHDLEELALHRQVTLRHFVFEDLEEDGGGRWTPQRLVQEVQSEWSPLQDGKEDVISCVAGHPALCHVVKEAWKNLGFPDPLTEDHCAAPPGSPRPQASIQVLQPGAPAWNFESLGLGRGIWHAALEAGFPVPPACRGSVCGQCEARLLKGACQEGLWSQPRGPEGPPIRLCRAHPVTSEVVVERLR